MDQLNSLDELIHLIDGEFTPEEIPSYVTLSHNEFGGGGGGGGGGASGGGGGISVNPHAGSVVYSSLPHQTEELPSAPLERKRKLNSTIKSRGLYKYSYSVIFFS